LAFGLRFHKILYMEHPDISITKLKDEIKQNYKMIDSLLKERNALKQAYSMQIDLVKALEDRIDKLQTNK